MTDRLPVGPYNTVSLADGGEAPLYIVPFDKRGRCDGPRTRDHLVAAVREGDFTDVFVFSHGWNNDWTIATKRYDRFLRGYTTMRREQAFAMERPFRPLLVGLFWPSTALVFGENEAGPDIAAPGGGSRDDMAIAATQREISEIADALASDDVERFYDLAQRDTLDAGEALELARMARVLYRPDDELDESDAPAPEDIVALWQASAALGETDVPLDFEDFGVADDHADTGPTAAGLLKRLDPRKLLRVLTVYRMKDRAGTVGARGVHAMLESLLAAGDARLHLLGHSYGAKVMLSAVAAGTTLSRPVRSMLLLQPAVSHLAFADRLPSRDRSGGYRHVLERVELPILSTYSKHDRSLTQFFHLALRREGDLGEVQIAGSGDPPSRYAALGGFGPRRAGERLIEMQAVGERYALDANVGIYGLRGDRFINGHGDISNEGTWWALFNLVSA